jgi:putative NADH-flavin reductase
MRIVVFGASGGTGRQIVAQAVAGGHSVRAFVRRKNGDLHPEAHVVEGDIFDPAAVADAIAGRSAVLSALGARSLRKEEVLSRALPHIIAGMRRHYVERIVALGASGARPGYGKYQNALTRGVFWAAAKTLLRHPFADQREQERLLFASELDFTIVRPPRLTDGPFTGKYRVLPDALPSGALRIARADVAHFMLLQLTDPRFRRQGPYIGG